ncbi:MAG: DUF1294 domain-containing protein [Romboutsia timonensis]|jgi:uncharacterized membrane protein YsdA (DUF1294 family)|uniref:DUF1294 domain-containing protein n=1 Tax=Romboutsia timonensis TaxID=1776391 RepID=UPI0008DB0A3C|nr:DUF1294 domain-containing protein [Romboutsia timonensis]MBS5026672.1 DUF1294 domain-containing protein [Peptostreptococcaceae bacterium]MDQ5923110.1 hypothetical protein [Bacillota bacterium]MDY3001368.1 DUF1294 domain-containing protein [Romboutsia timonensis]MEE0712800.1 DUF1294 domain-containing protein [Romboutsia timonensis]
MIYYLIFINIVGLLSMYLDKYFAKNNMYRISEKNLFFIAIIGGSIGSIIGMYQFRHKTKHRQFTTGLPFIIFIQIMILIYYT